MATNFTLEELLREVQNILHIVINKLPPDKREGIQTSIQKVNESLIQHKNLLQARVEYKTTLKKLEAEKKDFSSIPKLPDFNPPSENKSKDKPS